MLSSLLFYDRNGNVVATIDYMVARDEDGQPVGLIDFEAHEAVGGKMRDIADVQALDASIPPDVLREVLGREPGPRERHVDLPRDHPYRLAHETVAGAATWPEWLGTGAHDHTVVLDRDRRASALIHRRSGTRRDRRAITDEIERRQRAEAKAAEAEEREPDPVDIRDLVGGPEHPLRIDASGNRLPRFKVERADLPVQRARVE